MKLSKNFSDYEFECKCCGEVRMDTNFIKQLQVARDIAEIPFKITSGYRCTAHNANVGGVADSAHMAGMAADIAIRNSNDRFTIIKAVLEAGFDRVGEAETFVHVDIDPCKAKRVKWLY